MTIAERRCAALMACQHGLITYAQALELGMSNITIRVRVAGGRWLRMSRGVFALAGAPRSWHQNVLGVVLAAGPGAVASHRTAAALHGLVAGRPGIVEVSSVRHVRVAPAVAARLRKVRRLDAFDATVVERIPVTAVPRTLVDLAAVVRGDVLQEALEEALHRRMTSVADIRTALERLGRRGRAGIAQLQGLVEERSDGTGMSETRFETRLFSLLRSAGLPSPARQYRVVVGDTRSPDSTLRTRPFGSTSRLIASAGTRAAPHGNATSDATTHSSASDGASCGSHGMT